MTIVELPRGGFGDIFGGSESVVRLEFDILREGKLFGGLGASPLRRCGGMLEV